jgi:hypothetical protein
VSAGYAYTTISADPGEAARVGVSFYLDHRAWIDAHGLGTDRPHLAVSLGEVSVSIAPVPGRASAEDARIARNLASKAAEYAAAVEQLAAGNGLGATAA